MSSRPYLKLYIANYIADTRALDLDEHGAYLLLLFELWRRDGEIPAGIKSLAKAVGTTPSKFEKIWPAIQDYFDVDDESGLISNAKITRELELFREKSRKNSEAGRAGGIKSRRKVLENQQTEKAIAKRKKADAEKRLSITESEIEVREESPKPPSEPLPPKADRVTMENLIFDGENLRTCLEAEEAGDNKNPAYAALQTPEKRKAEVWFMARGILMIHGLDQKTAGAVIGEMVKKHGLDEDQVAAAAVIVWRAAPRSAKPYFVSVCERIANERRN